MTNTIPQERTFGALGGKSSLCAKLYPNGEAVVYRAREAKMGSVSRASKRIGIPWPVACLRLAILCPKVWEAAGRPLGLSILPIFDRLSKRASVKPDKVLGARSTKGLRGITSYGRRTVRNACYLLENRAGKARCVFATVTVPSLPVEQLRIVHENWSKVVEIYRLNMKRMLQDKKLSGEMITVSEVQEKRHQNTGLPILHLHSVFVGVTSVGKFAISIEQHDTAWERAIGSVIRLDSNKFPSACNLQRVRKSAAAYLGKYMSKGAKAITAIAQTEFSGWLPRHWWNCTRSLSRAIKQQTRRVDQMAEFLADAANGEGREVWEWHRTVSIETDLGFEYPIATYGKLMPNVAQDIHLYYCQAYV